MPEALSFGSFLSIARAVALRPEPHVLRSSFAGVFGADKGRGTAEGPLVKLIEVRNELGHNVLHLDRNRARLVEADHDPVGTLVAAVDAARSLLSFPLLVVEEQYVDQGVVTASCLHLVGESAPFPEEVELSSPVHFAGRPYFAAGTGLLSLSPGMIWEPVQAVEDIWLLDACSTIG